MVGPHRLRGQTVRGKDSTVDIPDTRYARTDDGVYIAYQTAGEGPIDYVWQFDHTGDVDLVWEHPRLAHWFRKVTSFCRLIIHDRRGTGLSSRNVPVPNRWHLYWVVS
jgi:hypothetical protein